MRTTITILTRYGCGITSWRRCRVCKIHLIIPKLSTSTWFIFIIIIITALIIVTMVDVVCVIVITRISSRTTLLWLCRWTGVGPLRWYLVWHSIMNFTLSMYRCGGKQQVIIIIITNNTIPTTVIICGTLIDKFNIRIILCNSLLNLVIEVINRVIQLCLSCLQFILFTHQSTIHLIMHLIINSHWDKRASTGLSFTVEPITTIIINFIIIILI